MRTSQIASGITIAAASTWDFGKIALKSGIPSLLQESHAVDAIEIGISTVELDTRDQYYVGVGGLPNANGEMELDAAIMDHNSQYGAVMALQHIKTPIKVARTVMEQCVHNVLVGDGALSWALSHGFTAQDDVLTEKSKYEWLEWKNGNDIVNEPPHDTIGVLCLDSYGNLCAGTSTSGWKFKHPGRIGDSPIVGSGLYCDEFGACVATGDGEEIMRKCLSFLVVEYIRDGLTPQEACVKGIERIRHLPRANKDDKFILTEKAQMYPALTVAIVAMDRYGNIGSASTLCELNDHRGRPFFPVPCWKRTFKSHEEIKEYTFDESHIETIEASVEGASL